MKKLQLLLLTLLIPFLGYTQINTFPWTHDFESFITLEEDTTDDGDWLLKQGPTSSFNTGPQGDHTTGNGIYYYVESSTPNYPGKVFTTYTPTFDVSYTPGQVISFWYHMHGSSMGDLEVGIVDNNGYTFLDIISGDQGDEWKIYYSAIPATDTFKIQFTAITGTLYYSDICIDDLYVGDPFTLGCMDVTALNYDASAIVDDGSCAYPPCQGFLTSNAYQNCQPNGQALTIFEWTLDTNVSCEPVEFHYWTPFNGPYQYGLNPNSTNFAVNAGTPNMPPNWSVPHFGQVEFADGSMSDTIFYTPYSCIPGCMDSTQVAYNPWANIDDGSCSGTTCDPTTETQITIEIRLDNWPQETGWTLTDGMGGTFNTPDGTYTYNDIGITYTYTYCVSATGPFEFVLSDTYGDGIQGNGTAGSAGDVIIYDCNGDTITYLSSGTWLDGNQTPVGVSFGTVAYSTPQFGVPCAGPPVIDGCMDPAYVQYNPLANNSAPWLCYWLHTYGCTDSTSFNYDPTATMNDIVDTCNYILKIEDDAADGWGNSYIGVSQGTNTWTYTMGSGNYVQTFPLTLETDKPVTVYYFEIPNAQNPDPQQTQFQTYQNSFTLTNADGVILLEEGTNPFANNGLGALQGFKAPFWTTYSATPYCGDYCIPTLLGCTDITAFNYDSTANTDDGNCIPVVLGCTNDLAFNYDSLANTDDGSCIAEVIGCMDSTAFNFNPSANTNDPSSCIPVIPGCMDDTMFNYNAAANTDDGSCIAIVYGCTDILAFNYDPLANTNNGSCTPVVLGCTNPTSFNYNQNANTDDGSCIPVVIGCTDPSALNYDSTANTNNGCIYPILGCTNPTSFNFNPNANTDDGTCIPVIIGCTDATALNYDSIANTNSGCIYPILGCTDPAAFNYDPNANTDDSTCVAVVIGCTDPTALNFDSLANTNSGCIYTVLGCTDPTMFNYDVNANVDDGSCVPVIIGCTDVTAFNYDSLANTNSGCVYTILGCTDPTMFNYDVNANTDDGSCVPVIIGCTDPSALNYDSIANTNSGCIYPFLGCTDPTMFNYDVNANVDDGSCIPFIYGCTNNLATNYNPTANTDNGSCILPILGCMDNTMFNYNPTATVDDNSCIPFINGCTDNTMFNYDPTANTDNGSCEPFVYGCMDSTAFNYDPLVNTDNGTCEGFVYGCTNPIALNYNPLANTDDLSCILPIYGCTDSTMFNFNPLANTDNGTCEMFVYGCTNPIALNYNVLANTDDGSCVTPIYGCMDSTMYNYNPLANVDNGSCEPFIYGCNDATAFNYDPLVNTSDNSCCYLSGCTDSTAVNYNSNACWDDGSCITPIVGCTDVSAYNYNPVANVSDSLACLYDAGCYGGPGIPYWLNDGCYAWVISVDDYCCTTDWDASCVSMYDYCQQGWPTDIEDISALGIVIYPNPTRDVITIETRLDIEVEVYDIMGKLIINKETKRIDLSEYPNGVYNLILIYNNKRFNTKVIKQ